MQYLIHELVSGGSPKQSGGFFTGNDIDIPVGDMRQLENFFNRLAFFPHILDYRGMSLVLKKCDLFSAGILCGGFLIVGTDRRSSVFFDRSYTCELDRFRIFVVPGVLSGNFTGYPGLISLLCND